MQNIIPIQSGVSFFLKAGESLKIVDVAGSQVCDLFCFNALDYDESLSSGRSIDYNDQIYLSSGHQLYSNRSHVMLTILEDTCGTHDFLLTPCSLKMFQLVAKNNAYHPSCHENLTASFKEFGIMGDQISTTFNIFMNVSVNADGKIKISKPRSKKGDYILFRAEMELLIGLTSCSHEETNDFKFSEIAYEIGSGQ